MNKIIICILYFIFLFSDCTHNTKSSNRVIQKLIRLGSSAEKIEDIFTPIDTVRFEYTPNSVLGTISQVCKHPNGYLILDDFYSNEVHLYDNRGIFVKRLGSTGQKPCEYRMPHYIFIDSLGNSYILDKRLRKIISFDLQGNYIKDISLIEFGIEPLSFIFDNVKKEFVVFAPFSTEPDHKIFVFREEGNKIKFKYSFGQSEILLQRIPFPISPFIITPSHEIWTGHCLSLDFQIYTVSGDIFKTKSNHIDMLPKPHISPVYFEGFDRLSDALDTYYKFTRFYKFYALDDFVMARYFGPMNVKTNNYYLFFTNEGDPLDILLREDNSKYICGCCENDIYIYLEPDVEEENPAIIRYRLKE